MFHEDGTVLPDSTGGDVPDYPGKFKETVTMDERPGLFLVAGLQYSI